MVARFFEDSCNLDKISSGVNASEGKEFKNSTVPCGADAGHGPMRSTTTSFQGVPAISQSGIRHWPGPEGLAH